MSSPRAIYTNPSASTTKTTYSTPPGLNKFHTSLPSYKPTPLTPLPNLAKAFGIRSILLKDESNRLNLPAFKVLGASWGTYRAVASFLNLPETILLEDLGKAAQENNVKLLAATKGNHGRAVAFMGRTLGVEVDIFVSESMDVQTRERIRSEGANVLVMKGEYDDAVREALRASQEEEGALLIQDTALDGYEEVPGWIVQGYGTMMAEIESQLSGMGSSANMMITPVGVGSLANTVATFCKSREKPISIVAVEPDTAACLQESLVRGELTTIETSYTIMDGMNCGTVSTTVWTNLQRLVDASVTVSCYESHTAVQHLGEQGITAGPCGAATLAALKRLAAEKPDMLNKDSVVVLLSTEGPREYPTPLDVSVDDAVGITSALTKIDSSNPTLSVADGVGEVKIADYLQSWFAHRGIESHRIEPVPGRPSVVGVLKGSGGGKSLMFNGHIDTVTLSSYEADPLSGHVDTRDGKQVVLGRGALDMKGGLAASLAAVSAIKGDGQQLRGDVIIAAVSDEENASQGTRDIIAAGWRADAAIVPEPTSEVIAHAHKGFVWVEVDILGVAAHGSDPTHGVDAILHAGWALSALENYASQLPVDDVLGPATLHCGLIQGGEEASSYPAKCTVTIEFRTVPGQTGESISSDIKSLLVGIQNEKKESGKEFRFAEPRATLTRPPHKIASDHPLISTISRCAETVSVSSPSVQSVPFWCDAALLSEAGILAVVFGPSGHGLHGKEEWVEVNSLTRNWVKLGLELEYEMDARALPNEVFTGAISLQDTDLHNGRGVDASGSYSWPPSVEEDMFFDWSALYGTQDPNIGLIPGERSSSEWSGLDFLSFDAPPPPLSGEFGAPPQMTFNEPALSTSNGIDSAQSQTLLQAQPQTRESPIVLPGFNNVAQWLDGAYRPSKPCDNCRRHRLQCLILRRTADNPNPVPSCSSCVGLFRPCSFGCGEKRQASGFETLSPVMGHLHGVIEEGDDSGSGPGARQPIPEGRESKQFVRRGARVLRDWFYRNEECPYPSEEEKARLASETGFTRQRISTWFANARRRSKQQRQAGSSARIYRAGSPMPTPLTQPMPIPMGGTGMLPSTMTPMERWQSSPPDEEPVSEDVIREAIASASGSDGSRPQSQVGTPFTDISSGGEGSLASSLSSFGIPPSDASDSSSSAWSFQSDGNLRARPYSRRPSSGRRGGRRRVADDGHYQCTFCTRSFKKKHDWSRHEKSVHLPLDVWICTPNLDELAQDPSLPPLECRFCENDPPTPEHWESHDFRDCATKPLAERSFSRKDYLWQHLRKFHGCTRYPVSNLDAWKSSQSAIQSRCGFCQESLASWAARTDHLAAHFKEGCRMSQWAGDWGFESAILASLRNAVLPIERGFLDMAA
ncbi:uncharacterized protein BDV14DRAFT_208986 [Aspergillus stella-maris]|uniref:uncharacterized protein n=1 Tax=Aspergillus stella-maris TaxID=1810926 RepID=UPI003CCCF91C